MLGTLVALFSGGHVLIESVPGLGKTLFVRTLGRVLGCKFGRIQFTADLMPSDITGAPIFDMKTQEFRFRPGPGLHAVAAGRRDQPLAGQDARGPAGDHAGIPRHGRAASATSSSGRSWCWPRRTRSNRKEPTTCPRPSSTASCSSSWPTIPTADEEADDPADAQPSRSIWTSGCRRIADGHLARRRSSRSRRLCGAGPRRRPS